MTDRPQCPFRVAIACGGTGGHLFPGVAVAQELTLRGSAVTLLVSSKEVDQKAVQGIGDIEVITLPAVGLTRGRVLTFALAFARSYRLAKSYFLRQSPGAVLAMGGFTSAPPVLAARRLGARSFLHESNTIPGRANRWLSWGVTTAFTGFPEAGKRLHTKRVVMTGTPVRAQFKPRDAGSCRWALGLEPGLPVVLVMGGSQGASAINQLVADTLPLAKLAPPMQWVHLCGAADYDAVKSVYAAHGVRAVVHPFFQEMEVALGAATVAVCRAGGSSLAELAAVRVPAILIPYPSATDDHQTHNARAYQESGAALLLPQREAEPKALLRLLSDLVDNPGTRLAMQRALDRWHKPKAAGDIAEAIIQGSTAGAGIKINCAPGSLPGGPPRLERSSAGSNSLTGIAHEPRQEVAA